MTDLDLINEFIERKALNKKDILGIVFYGSSCYKTATKHSDIDLLIITNSSKNYKGVVYLHGRKIEYFEKSIYDLEDQISELSTSTDESLFSIFKNGQIIISQDQTVEYLRERVLSVVKCLQKKANSIVPKSNIAEIESVLSANPNNKFTRYLLFNLLEEIRRSYHEQKQYSRLPTNKVYDLYANAEYAKTYYCVKLPPEDFRKKYLSLIVNPEEEKIKHLKKYLKPSKEKDNFPKKYNMQKLTFSSTVISTAIEKCNHYEQEKHPYFEASYYLALEKLRIFYCHQHGLSEGMESFGKEYDREFLEMFDKALEVPRTSNLQELFDYLTEPLNMNYRDYKILQK